MTSFSRWRSTLASLLVLAATAGARAEDVPFAEPWTIDGEVRLRGEYRQNEDLNENADDKDQATQSRIRLGVKVTPLPDLTAYVQLQDSRLFGSETSTASNEKNVDLHQGYFKVDHLFGEGSGVSLQAGRFEMMYGDQRLIGAFNWNVVARSFDGARLSSALGEGSSIDLFATKVRESAAKKGDNEDADFQGLYYKGSFGALKALDLYVLRLADGRAAAGELAGQKGATNLFTWGSRLFFKAGGFDGRIEGAWQNGDRNGSEHRAWAGSAVVEQAVGVVTVGAGYAIASGDAKADGESREFENLFPTNHIFYGDMDMIGWRNMRNPFLRFRTKVKDAQLRLDIHRFELQEETGAWKSAAGALLGRDATGSAGRHLGNEIDLIVTMPFKEKLKVEAGIGHFQPGDAGEKLRGDEASTWGYLQLGMAF